MPHVQRPHCSDQGKDRGQEQHSQEVGEHQFWGTDTRTIRTTAAAEYASPVWSRSSHASKIDPVLNAACRAISGCLRPTRVDTYTCCAELPHHISDVSSQLEKLKQENDPLHSLYEQDPARKRRKSRHLASTLLNPLMAAPTLGD